MGVQTKFDFGSMARTIRLERHFSSVIHKHFYMTRGCTKLVISGSKGEYCDGESRSWLSVSYYSQILSGVHNYENPIIYKLVMTFESEDPHEAIYDREVNSTSTTSLVEGCEHHSASCIDATTPLRISKPHQLFPTPSSIS